MFPQLNIFNLTALTSYLTHILQSFHCVLTHPYSLVSRAQFFKIFIKLADLFHFIKECNDSILFKCDNESRMQFSYQFEIDVNAAKRAQAKTIHSLAWLNLCEYKQRVFLKQPIKYCKVYVMVK